MVPFAGRGYKGGGRLSRNHAAGRRRGARADARCQRGVQGEWPAGISQQGQGGGLKRTDSILTPRFLGPDFEGCFCAGGVPGASPE